MYRTAFAVSALAVALCLATIGPAQAQKAKGQLPQGWKELGLSATQKDEAYKVRAAFKAKLDALNQQEKQLKQDEKAELVKILTPDQRKKLAAILTGEKTEEKKADK